MVAGDMADGHLVARSEMWNGVVHLFFERHRLDWLQSSAVVGMLLSRLTCNARNIRAAVTELLPVQDGEFRSLLLAEFGFHRLRVELDQRHHVGAAQLPHPLHLCLEAVDCDRCTNRVVDKREEPGVSRIEKLHDVWRTHGGRGFLSSPSFPLFLGNLGVELVKMW